LPSLSTADAASHKVSLALDDYALKARVAAWRGIRAVLQDAAHSAR
jgi:hypothetical protein